MDAIDEVLTTLTEKQLMILNFRVQANMLIRLERLERMASLIQTHLLPKNSEHYLMDSGNALDALIEMLPFAAKTNWDLDDNDIKLREIVENAVYKLTEFKGRFDENIT